MLGGLLAALSIVAPARADTFDNYMNSITRQQIESMGERARANAPDGTLKISPVGKPGFIRELERRAQEQRDAAAMSAQAYSDWIDRKWAAENAQQDARNVEKSQQVEQARREHKARIDAWLAALPQDKTMSVADFEQLIALSTPDAEFMMRAVDAAYQQYPREFILAKAVMMLTWQPRMNACGVLTYPRRYTQSVEEYPEIEYRASQPMRARDYLRGAMLTGNPVDLALACAIGQATVDRYEDYFWRGWYQDPEMLAAYKRWLAPQMAACATGLPEGHAFREGLFEPMRARYAPDRSRLNTVMLLSLVDRANWRDVTDYRDAAAIRRAFDRGVERINAFKAQGWSGCYDL